MTIEINNLQFSYTDSPNANLVDIPKLHIAKGEQLLINGPSGCGKSTLLNLICGMLSPTQGEITVLNTRIDSLRAHQRDRFRAKHIGYVFQQFNLIPYLNAIDNIKLASYFSKDDTKQNIAEITQLLADLNVAEANWQSPCAQLSIGQQQRIAIARALINKPEILIADEPTSSLDHDNRDKFMSLLMPIVKEYKITLVMVSHDPALSQYFDDVLLFSNLNSAGR